MQRWKGTINFEKYYGERKYKEKQLNIKKNYFTPEEKNKILREIMSYIKEKDFALYRDLMDDICENNEEWFNLLTYDKKSRQFILTYIKSKKYLNIDKKESTKHIY